MTALRGELVVARSHLAKLVEDASSEFAARQRKIVGDVGRGQSEFSCELRVRRLVIVVVEVIPREETKVERLPFTVEMIAEALHS